MTRFPASLAVFVAFMMAAGCGGDTGTGGGSCTNVAGTWLTAQTQPATSCSSATSFTRTETITQTGCSVGVTDSGGMNVTCTMSGNVMSCVGTQTTTDGTTTTHSTGTFASSTAGTTSYTWTFVGTAGSCSGTGTTTLTKQ